MFLFVTEDYDGDVDFFASLEIDTATLAEKAPQELSKEEVQ